jgi:SAM-dependent methyltransferase
MSDETTKSRLRRLPDQRFVNQFFVGRGIDIGCGEDSLGKHTDTYTKIVDVKPWDLPDGDAQYMNGVEDNYYDFVHSSHCLEHMRDPHEAMQNWIRICKPGGYIVVTIPEEDLYEQGVWPSTFNSDHKTSWTIAKEASWSPVSVSLIPFLYNFIDAIEIIKVELIDHKFVYGSERIDQTRGDSESAIEFIIRKR